MSEDLAAPDLYQHHAQNENFQSALTLLTTLTFAPPSPPPPPPTRPPLPLQWRRSRHAHRSQCSDVTQRSHMHLAHERPCLAPSLFHHVNVYRFNPQSSSAPWMDSYAVRVDSCGPMLLDVLLAVKNTVDATLTLRRSCREGQSASAHQRGTPQRGAGCCR